MAAPSAAPGCGPEHVGIRERIPQQPLERGAGHREPEADDHCREDPRQPQVHDDGLGRGRPRLRDGETEEPASEDRQGLTRRNRHGSQAHPEDESDHEQPQRSRGDQPRPAPDSTQALGRCGDEGFGTGGH